MAFEIDHVFVCTEIGAPVAERLISSGFSEGAPNTHPGQGTACRRFFFHNMMLELIWVSNSEDAQSPQTAPTNLWKRWSSRAKGASPFGVILAPSADPADPCPFDSWLYKPALIPDLVIHIASNEDVDQPMWCYLPFARHGRYEPPEHSAGVKEVTRIVMHSPALRPDSVSSTMARMQMIELQAAGEHLFELEFDGAQRGRVVDFRPHVPLRFVI